MSSVFFLRERSFSIAGWAFRNILSPWNILIIAQDLLVVKGFSEVSEKIF